MPEIAKVSAVTTAIDAAKVQIDALTVKPSASSVTTAKTVADDLMKLIGGASPAEARKLCEQVQRARSIQ